MYLAHHGSLRGFGYIGETVPIKAGQIFYYSANISGKDLSPILGIFGGGDWNEVARRVLASVSNVATGSVTQATQGNITLAVASSVDRASQGDLQYNLDQAVEAQPEVFKRTGSVLRLTDAGLNPKGRPFEITPAMWAVIGVGLFLLLRR